MKGIVWVEESNENSIIGKKKKRRVGKRKLEFDGWGSRPLIEFLEAIGKDATTKHSQHEVAAIIIKYINENNLFCPQRKKKILCDDRLYALFAKKSMFRTKVYDMLEEHFAENHDESEDEFTDSSDEENYREMKRNHNVQMKIIPRKPKSCFAAVVSDNIKLLYLKNSLIQEFLQVPESFDCKIVGSFVRMSSDPFDIYQKNLSSFNWSQEEIEDVRDRIKAGSLKRLTVWIAKDLVLLKRRIDHANDKGWRKELHEHLERRKLLQTPSEVEKLLLNIPEVIAEELEPDVCENAEGIGCSPTSVLRGTSDVSSTDASGSGDLATPSQVVTDNLPTPRRGNGDMINHIIITENLCGSGDFATPSQVVTEDLHIPSGQNGDTILTKIPHEIETSLADWLKLPTQTSKQVEEIDDQPADLIQEATSIIDSVSKLSKQ